MMAALRAGQEAQHDEGEDQQDPDRHRPRRPDIHVRTRHLVLGQEARLRLLQRQATLVDAQHVVPRLDSFVTLGHSVFAFRGGSAGVGLRTLLELDRAIPLGERLLALPVGLLAGVQSAVTLYARLVALLDRPFALALCVVALEIGDLALALDGGPELGALGEHRAGLLALAGAGIGHGLLLSLTLSLELAAERPRLLVGRIAFAPHLVALAAEALDVG